MINKKARVLLMNDMHVSTDTIPEFLANWKEALEICKKQDIKYMAIGGDLFKTRAAQTLDVLLAVYDAFDLAKSRQINIWIANGNHDKVNQESIRGYCHVFKQFDNVTVVDEDNSFHNNGSDQFVLHMIPYFPENGTFESRLSDLIEKINWKGGSDVKRILYIHEGINGALAHSSDKELPASIFLDFDKVLVGHYHNRCKVEGTNIEYIGSSRQHNFGEDEEKGYTIIFEDGSTEFIQNKVNIRYKNAEVTFDKINTNLIDWLNEMAEDPLVKVKLHIHCTSEQASSVDKQALLAAGANKVEIIAESKEITEASKSSLFVKFNQHEIKKSYEDFCAEKGVDDVAFGAGYLSKID